MIVCRLNKGAYYFEFLMKAHDGKCNAEIQVRVCVCVWLVRGEEGMYVRRGFV